jgi:hypothetical protein
MSIIIEEKKGTSRGEVAVCITLPDPPAVSKYTEERILAEVCVESMDELIEKSWEPVVKGLAAYIAGSEMMGELGPLAAIPILQQAISESAGALMEIASIAVAAERRPPTMPSPN